jgi:hypothetical protein
MKRQSFWTNPRNAGKVEQYKRNRELKSFGRNAMTGDQLQQAFNRANIKGTKK